VVFGGRSNDSQLDILKHRVQFCIDQRFNRDDFLTQVDATKLDAGVGDCEAHTTCTGGIGNGRLKCPVYLDLISRKVVENSLLYLLIVCLTIALSELQRALSS
jgi:hypothetical protein